MAEDRTQKSENEPLQNTAEIARDELGRFGAGNQTPGQVKPGEVRNPGGQPKGTPKPGRWIPYMVEQDEDELARVAMDRKASASKRMAAILVLEALDREDRSDRKAAHKMLLERVEGKPDSKQQIEHTGDDRRISVVIERPDPPDTPKNTDEPKRIE